jgi:aspartyl-tRNA(Asn)/glutamyl-tRNA(Gln) amidotransferase subunit B
MQEGSFRCDANVSVRKPGEPLGTRREIKNLNSFKFMQQAIDYEVRWQIDQIEDGHAIEQATVLFDPDTGETRAMRTKEDAADYRYFPDPDLPPLVISREWVEKVKSQLPELPEDRVKRFMGDEDYKKTLRSDIETAYNQVVYGLSEYDARTLVSNRAMADYFEATAKACGQPKLASNWIMGEVSRRLNSGEVTFDNIPVSAAQLGALISRISDNTISNSAARQVFDGLWNQDGEVDAIIEAKGLKQINDTGALEAIIDEVLAANPKNVEEFKAGNAKALNGLVGPIMKASKGKANPAQVNELLMKKLS